MDSKLLSTSAPKKIRVLHIYRTYFPETQGGLQEAIRQFCFATQPYQVENTIFALARNPVPNVMKLDEGKLVRSRSWLEIASCDLGSWDAIRRCRAEAEQCDIIQIHYPWPFADILLSLIRTRQQPVIVTYVSDIVRQNFLGQLYAPLRNWLLNTATRIVASSPNYVQSSEILQAYPNKVECIPHCLGEAPPLEQERVDHWKSQFGTNFFLFVGVLRYYKGLDFLLQAAEKVAHPILIVGDGPEGERLKKYAEDKHLTHVHFLGALPDNDKLALFSLCRAVVFPSHLRSEAFGITLLEGARASKPLISCEIGSGTTWVNQHNETGIIIPPENPVALAEAMNQLVSDTALCQRLGQGAKQRWQSHFSLPVVGAAYRKIYDEVLGQTGIETSP